MDYVSVLWLSLVLLEKSVPFICFLSLVICPVYYASSDSTLVDWSFATLITKNVAVENAYSVV
jgi:hypothetical protein